MGIIIQGLTKSYENKKVLDEIQLNIPTDKITTILGPSGSGKSTLLYLIAGLEEADEGKIHFVEEKDQQAIMIFQEYQLFPHMTVFENVAFGLKIRKFSKAVIREKVRKILEVTEMLHKINAYPDELSGGQKQRVALARGLVVEPSVLLLDEPFASLDGNLRIQMRQFLLQLQHALGVTMILVTHDKEDAFELSDQIVLLFDGHVLQVGTGKELDCRPVSLEVAKFMGRRNFIHGKIINGYFHSSVWQGEIDGKSVNVDQAVVAVPYFQKIEISPSTVETDSCIVIVTEKKWHGNGYKYLFTGKSGEALYFYYNGDEIECGDSVTINWQAEGIRWFS